MTIRLLAAASAAVLALSCASAQATTLEVVSGPTGQRSVTFPGYGPVGQSFTAFDSVLNSVGFQFNALNPSSASTPFTLSLLAGSTLSGPALFTTSFTLPTSINSRTATWFDIALSDWGVVTGEQYTFVLTNGGNRNGVILGPEINIPTGQVLGGDAYAGGTALFGTQPYSGFCANSGICDLNFRITATTPPAVPEPATWAMMIAGFGIAGGMLRGKRRAAAYA